MKQGNLTYVKSTERWIYEEPVVEKVDKQANLTLVVPIYGRPWVPEDPENQTIVVSYVYRDWSVSSTTVYGGWSNGPPPLNATCTTYGPYPYKRVVIWMARSVADYAYAFAWLSSVDASRSRGPHLPDTNGTSYEDGYQTINLLGGAEYGWTCEPVVLQAEEPNWTLVPRAVENMTALARAWANYSLLQGAYVSSWAKAVEAASGSWGFAVETAQELLARYKPIAYWPLPSVTPSSYRPYNILIVCLSFNWTSAVKAPASMTLTPGREIWLTPPGGFMSSGASWGLVYEAAREWGWLVQHPPPPAPVFGQSLLPAQGGWINMTAVLKALGPLGYAAMLFYYPAAVSANWFSLYPRIYTALIAAVALFEALSAVLGFPSPGVMLFSWVWGVLEDLVFWYQIRLFIKARLLGRIGRFLRSPVRAAAARLVRKLYYKGYLKVKESERWKLEAELGLRLDDRIREEIERRAVEKLTGRKKMEALADRISEAARDVIATAATVAVKAGEAAYEVGERAYRAAKTAYEYTRGDLIDLLRRIPAVDRKMESFLEYAAKRHPLVYHLLLSRLDDKPRWISILDLPRLRMLAEMGEIKWETYQRARNLVEYYYAERAYQRYRAIVEKLDEEKVYEAALKMAERAVERSEKALYVLYYDLARGVSEEEILRRIRAVVNPINEIYQGAFSRFSQIVARAVDAKAPKTPEELARLMAERRDVILQRAPLIAEEWRQYWSAREVPYPSRERMEAVLAEFARIEIAKELGDLKAAALARRAAYLALEYVSTAKALEAKLGTPEEVALRARLGELERQLRGVVEEARRMMADKRVQLPAWEAAERGGVYALELRNLDYVIRNKKWLERVFEVVRVEKVEGVDKEVLKVDERAARKTLEATWRLAQEFGERYVWLRHGPEERIYAVPKPGVEEVERALDRALKTYAQHGREAAIAEFRRAVEEAKQFYAARGGREAVENIEALEKRLVKLLEELPERPPAVVPREDITGRLAAVERARRALAGADAAKAIRLAREADQAAIAEALELGGEAEAVKAFVQRAKAIDYAALTREAGRAFDELAAQVIAALRAVDEYVRFKTEAASAQDKWLKALYQADAERALRTVKTELELARQIQRRAEEALARVKDVEEVKPPRFGPLDLSQDVKVQRSEFFLPEDAALYALAIAFTRRLDAVKRAKTAEDKRKAVAELAAVAELLREYPRERVAKALEESRRAVYFKAGSIELKTERAEKLLAALGYAALAATGRQEAAARLEELARELGVSKEVLLRAVSISPALAEAVEAVRELAARDPKFAKMVEEAKSEKDLEKIRAYLRAEAKALRAAERLDEYLRSPTVEADVGLLMFAAERLGLKEVKKLLEVIGRMKGELSFYEERYYNVVYERLLPLLGWRAERMLLRAPPAVYVLNRMGADLAKEVFSKYRGFEAFGSELRDVVPRVDLPLSVGMPVSLSPRFESYPKRATRYVADWSDLGLASGIRRYYATEEA